MHPLVVCSSAYQGFLQIPYKPLKKTSSLGFSTKPTTLRFNRKPQKGLLLRTAKIPSEYLPKNLYLVGHLIEKFSLID